MRGVIGRIADIRRSGFSPAAHRSICIAALVLLSAIVVTGAAVRLTGSGLGCDDWPNCNGTTFIDVSNQHAAIEQVNRLFTFLVSIGVALAAAAAWFRQPRRRDLTRLGFALLLGVPAQGVVGGQHASGSSPLDCRFERHFYGPFVPGRGALPFLGALLLSAAPGIGLLPASLDLGAVDPLPSNKRAGIQAEDHDVATHEVVPRPHRARPVLRGPDG